MDVVALTAEIMKGTHKDINLRLIRESIIVLLDVWNEQEANKKLAAVQVMARLHGVSIQLKPHELSRAQKRMQKREGKSRAKRAAAQP